MTGADQRASTAAVLGRADVAWVVAGDELVVHSAGSTHLLDATSAVVWQCLDGVSSLHEVFTDIAAVFAVPLEQVAADCMPAIESWIAAGIAVDTSQPTAQPDTGELCRTWRRLVDPPST